MTTESVTQKTSGLNKINIILIGLLVIQALLMAAVYWPKAAAGKSELKLEGVTKDNITALHIIDAEGKEIAMKKTGEGWVLPEMGDYPVDESKITPLLEKLDGFKTNRLVTRTKESHKQLQVADDDFARKLEITTADGQVHTLYVGASGGPGATHVRLSGEPEAYLTGDLTSWDINTAPSGWIDNLYFTLDKDAVLGLSLKNSAGQLDFNKDDEGNLVLNDLQEGEEMDTAAANGLLNRVISVRMSRPLSKEENPAYGLDKPQASVTLRAKTDDGSQTYTLLLGQPYGDQDEYVFHASNSPYYVLVSNYIADDLSQKTRQDFIKNPEPTPQPTAVSQ